MLIRSTWVRQISTRISNTERTFETPLVSHPKKSLENFIFLLTFPISSIIFATPKTILNLLVLLSQAGNDKKTTGF